MNKILNFISTIIYTLIILALIFLVGSLVLDRINTPIKYKIYSVDSGSMNPKIPLGSMIVVVPQSEYKIDDAITFREEKNPQRVTTHRVVDIERDDDIGKLLYQTKGDANNAADPELISKDRVVGKVVFSVPFLGFPVSFSRTRNGFILLVIVPAVFIALGEIFNIGKEVKRLVGKKVIK